MQQLSLKARPEYKPIFGDAMFMAGASFFIMVMGACGTASDVRNIIGLLVFATIALFIWALSATTVFFDRSYNRKLPECIENHLNSNLDQADYGQLHQAALKYPAIRLWISDCIKNGELTYREAEPLFMRINLYIASHETAAMPPPEPLNNQEQLLQLLQSGAPSAIPSNGGRVFVSVRLDTSGRKQVLVRAPRA